MPDVITAGETMVLGVPSAPGRLRHAAALELKIGGAESNVAIALGRLGVSVGWTSFLGNDEVGQLVLDRIRGEGVDTSRVRRVPDLPTGLYLREIVAGSTRAYYYRSGSAASTMSPDAFDPAYLEGTKILHLTGVTPALSGDCADFVRWAAREARSRGVTTSFDVNYRSKLWPPGAAKSFAEELMPEVDLLFVGDDEARAIWGADDEEFARSLAALGPREVVVKCGKTGCFALAGDRVIRASAFEVEEVDSVGAGDAHAAGYLAGVLWKRDVHERLRLANALGAYSVMTLGDYEGLPGRKELYSMMDGEEDLGR